MSPSVGRFMQHDPLMYVDGFNMYEYVGNMPVVMVDPLGKVAFSERTKKMAGAGLDLSSGFSSFIPGGSIAMGPMAVGIPFAQSISNFQNGNYLDGSVNLFNSSVSLAGFGSSLFSAAEGSLMITKSALFSSISAASVATIIGGIAAAWALGWGIGSIIDALFGDWIFENITDPYLTRECEKSFSNNPWERISAFGPSRITP